MSHLVDDSSVVFVEKKSVSGECEVCRSSHTASLECCQAGAKFGRVQEKNCLDTCFRGQYCEISSSFGEAWVLAKDRVAAYTNV